MRNFFMWLFQAVSFDKAYFSCRQITQIDFYISATVLYISYQASYFWSFHDQEQRREEQFWKRVRNTVNAWGHNTKNDNSEQTTGHKFSCALTCKPSLY